MKRLFFITLALLIATALFVACGGSDQTTETTTTIDTSTSQSESTTTLTQNTTAPKPENEAPPTTEYETLILNNRVDAYLNDTAEPCIVDWIEFSDNWRCDKGYDTRFIGGDEHWVSAGNLSNGELATCTVTFFGTSIALYGHTCPAGGMANITLDGVEQTELCDFYTPDRTESLSGKHSGTLKPFFVSGELENAVHTLIITFARGKTNPATTGNAEIAMDYAVVTRIVGTAPSIIR